VARYQGFLSQGLLITSPVTASGLLVGYILAAITLIVLAARPGNSTYLLALVSVFIDVVFVSLLMSTFGGVDSGLGVLLVFAVGAGAILLPLRLALFMSAIAALAIIGEVILSGFLAQGAYAHLLRSGLYGVTVFITTVLVHLLAQWGRDFRLTAERQAKTLSRLEEINELIIRRMRSGVLAIDAGGDIRLMNESAWYQLGSPPPEHRRLEDVAPELQERLVVWRADPRVQAGSVTLQPSQAEVVPHFVELPAGLELAALLFLEDSDVVARRAREISAHSLARLSSSIAHEIRNPLSAIRHAAQLLGESEALDEADTRLAGIIEKQSQRMNRIVENILQISRREKSQPEVLDLTAWLPELVEEFRAAHPELQLGLHLPEGAREVNVIFDRSQLHQVVWKLLDNALRHAGRPLPELQLGIHCEPDQPTEGFCLLSVLDNGQGIAQERIEQVFDAFFTTHNEGSGLGLYIARQLCEANQAELTVDSAPDRYTRFRIRLALAAGSNRRTEPE
jgi:two-component system sensor histidine kinase PilS (NtrC family)